MTPLATYCFGLYWFSLKWRMGCSELRTSGRPSPGIHDLLTFQDSGLCPEGFIAWVPIPKGEGKTGDARATRPSVLAPGAALGSVPTVALSSAQAVTDSTFFYPSQATAVRAM